MDRDMVNCLHYLYQWGPIGQDKLYRDQAELFWCDPDTVYPLRGRGIVDEASDGKLMLPSNVFDLIDTLENQLRAMPQPDFALGYPISAAIRSPGSTRPAFLAIDYGSEFDPVKQVVLAAGARANFHCEVTGDLSSPGDIMDQVWQGIRGADVVVADITGGNPNVFYEIGLAHALGKEVVIITQGGDAPFDIRSVRRIDYDATNLTDLDTALEDAFRSVSARYPHEGPEPRF